MKRLILLGMLLALACGLMTGCGATVASVDAAVAEAAAAAIAVDVDIREKLFIAQSNDIYLNQDEYMGKTIRLEGIFVSTIYEPTGAPLSMVFRYGPGCCGDDDMAGFEVAWPQGDNALPENNAWVEAIGVLDTYEEDGSLYLYLNLLSLRTLETRGAETVLQ